MDFGTDRKEVLDKNTLKDWVAEAEDGSFSIDEEKVKEYVAGLAKNMIRSTAKGHLPQQPVIP